VAHGENPILGREPNKVSLRERVSQPVAKIRIAKQKDAFCGRVHNAYIYSDKTATLFLVAPPVPLAQSGSGKENRVIYLALFGVGVHMFFNPVAKGGVCLVLIPIFAHSL